MADFLVLFLPVLFPKVCPKERALKSGGRRDSGKYRQPPVRPMGFGFALEQPAFN